jgi:hypothetical protein
MCRYLIEKTNLALIHRRWSKLNVYPWGWTSVQPPSDFLISSFFPLQKGRWKLPRQEIMESIYSVRDMDLREELLVKAVDLEARRTLRYSPQTDTHYDRIKIY